MQARTKIDTAMSAFSGWVDRLLLSPWPIICLLALVCRLVFVAIPSFHHPDEIYQYIEQSNRLAGGPGLIPWEYRHGIRSWALPALLTLPMWLGDRLGIGAVEFARVCVSILSLLIVYSFYRFGRTISPLHGLLVGFIGAVWFELVYFGNHTLSEPIALALFLPGALLLKDAQTATWRQIFLAGLLLGFAFLFRLQMAPAIATLAVLTCRWDFRRAWVPALAGGALALLAGASIDLAAGAWPFAWVFDNLAVNVGADRASGYGTASGLYYALHLAALWNTSAIILVPLALFGARRYPALFAAALVHVLMHSLIGHKEYRFVLLTNTILVLFAGIGFADLFDLATRSWPKPRRNLATLAALLFWLATSAMLGVGERFRELWTSHYSAISASRAAGHISDVCGVALYNLKFFDAGGYSYLRRDVPTYAYFDDFIGDFGKSQRAFNVVLGPDTAATAIGRAYRQTQCFAPIGFKNSRWPENTVCLYRRAGPCDGRGVRQINDMLRIRDE